MSEQGGRRLMEGNPKILGALDVLLLCLQVAAFLSSLDALERYSCVRGNYAVYLLNPFSCLSPVCDCFRADLCPGSDLRFIWWGSTALLVSATLSCLFSPAVLTDHGEGDFWGTHQSPWLVCTQVKGEDACEICDKSLQLGY